MHVDQKPPLWPYLVSLMMLLALCLAAPHYWQPQQVVPHNVRTRQPRLPECVMTLPPLQQEIQRQEITSPTRLTDTAPKRIAWMQWPIRRRVPLVIAPAATASGVYCFLPEALAEPELSSPVVKSEHVPAQRGRLVLIPPVEPELPSGKVLRPASLDHVLPGFDTASALRRSGHFLANQLDELQPVRIADSVVTFVANRVERIPEPPRSVSPSEKHALAVVAGPHDRLAMVPDRRVEQPSLDRPILRRSVPNSRYVDESDSHTMSTSFWRVPTALVTQLKRLERHPESANWASDALASVAQLTATVEPSSEAAERLFDRLGQLASRAGQMATETRDERLRTELLRSHYALARRVEIWSMVNQIHTHEEATPHARLVGQQRLQRALTEIRAITQDAERGPGWQDYLLVEPLAEVAKGQNRMTPQQQRRLAKEILARVTTGRLTASQRHFVSSSPVASLTGQLRECAAEPVDLERLAANLESYEQSRQPRLAQDIAIDRRKLAWSPSKSHRALAENIDEHYRNANVRLAITVEMLNRLLPQSRGPEYREVRDRIVGTPVRGSATADSVLKVRLIPDEHFLRFGIEAHGNVHSRTVANGGAARLWSHGQTQFLARKLVVVTHEDMRVWPAVAEAESHNRLVGLKTDYDSIPLVGSWVRSEAKSEYQQKRPWARAEVEFKAAQRAQQALDAQTGPELEKLKQRVIDEVAKLEESGVNVEPIALSTTDQRIVARLRVAGDTQLAAHTPRNRAPADSLASLQIHESVLANITHRLNLDGQQLTAVALRDLLREQFPRLQSEPPEEVPADAVFHFDYEDSLQFHIDDGQLEITLGLVELIIEGRSIRRFKVHAFYQLRVEETSVQLVRDGALGVEGRIRTTDRGRLHAVFNKVLSEDQPIPIVDLTRLDGAHPEGLDGLMFTQAVLEDGWLGLAIGPTSRGRTAQLFRSMR